MKDQYFGDINDYRKYGLLRVISDVTQLQTLVAWMLTPDDGSTDGKFTAYLEQPKVWRAHDSALFDGLKGFISGGQPRSVRLIEATHLLPGARYHSDIVPEAALKRDEWFQSLLTAAALSELVFLDPDNGLEIQSCRYGRKNSSKFAYWKEVEAIWKAGKSLLIYQHFIREKRPFFVQRMLRALEDRAPESCVAGFSTASVLFLLALQPAHRKHHNAIVSAVQARWGDQIAHWRLAAAQQLVTVDD